MRGNWVGFNPMSQRCKFLELTVGCEENLTNAWALHEKTTTLGDRGDGQAQKHKGVLHDNGYDKDTGGKRG